MQKSCCWLLQPKMHRECLYCKNGAPHAPLVCLFLGLVFEYFLPKLLIHCGDPSTFSQPFPLGINVWFGVKLLSTAVQLQK